MELEKSLFRVHERILSNSLIKYPLAIAIIALSLACEILSLHFLIAHITIALWFFLLFTMTNVRFRDQSPCLQAEYEGFKAQILNGSNHLTDEILQFRVVNMLPQYKNQTYSSFFFNLTAHLEANLTYPNDSIFVNASNLTNASREDPRDFGKLYEHPALFVMEFTQMPLSMPSETRKQHQFITHHILIDADCYAQDFLQKTMIFNAIGIEAIVINEILSVFRNVDLVILKNMITDENWYWHGLTIRAFLNHASWPLEMLYRILGMFEIFVGLFLVSNITAIYIKMTIICAPIFILMLTDCCIKFGVHENISRIHIFKAFPWVGIYLYAMAYNNRKAEKYIYFAFFCMIFLFYFVYLASSSIWTFLLFRGSRPAGLDENFYGFIACIEFLSILFIRTRSSLKYAPLFLNLLFVFFLYYVKFTLYGFSSLALSLVICLSFAFFGLILLIFEIPALTWNPSYHYVPSLEKPRLLYFPLFSMTSYYDLPHFWSMFYPLHDRSFFTPSQMSLIDRNYLLMNSNFENARINHELNMDGNNSMFNEMNFDVEMQNMLNAPQNQNQNQIQPQNNNNNNENNQRRPQILSEEDNSIHQNLLVRAGQQQPLPERPERENVIPVEENKKEADNLEKYSRMD